MTTQELETALNLHRRIDRLKAHHRWLCNPDVQQTFDNRAVGLQFSCEPYSGSGKEWNKFGSDFIQECMPMDMGAFVSAYTLNLFKRISELEAEFALMEVKPSIIISHQIHETDGK